MFWSGNYIVVRELKCLLKEENVTLTQILEADDILQECKADNKALIQFLTRPDILAELITLITEEPPKNVELSSQYRHANIASEVLTSNLSMLRDRLSMDAVQMNRLCDFVDRDPPLNPLLASYFSKTIEMLLERSPKQDWYLHHIVCLHVLDLFKARRDFLPNLLRHISTSAICDTFKCFLHLGSPFNKIILEWLDEHQFLESLIAVICGTYDADEAVAAQRDARLDSNHNAESGDTDTNTEVVSNRSKPAETNGETVAASDGDGRAADCDAAVADARVERVRAVAAFNAAALLCDVAVDAASVDPFNNEWYAGRTIAARLRGEEAVRRLLQGVFTSPAPARRHALVNACRLLLTLLSAPPAPLDPAHDGAEAAEEARAAAHGAVERAIAPHLPLLHHALLHPAPHNANTEGSEGGGGACGETVGAARVSVAALVARLALSEVDDVPTALISLGTAGVLVDMLFRFPHNNFLHAQVCSLVHSARANRRFSHRYTAHLIEECNLLTRLMDAFEQNEDKKGGGVRAGYMGHVVAALRALDAAPPVLPSALQQRWAAFRDDRLRPLLQRHDTPLGGVYPWENNMYEMGTTIQVLMDNMADTLEDSYDFNETAATLDEEAEACEPFDIQLEEKDGWTKDYFLQLVNYRRSGFDDQPAAQQEDAEPPPLPLHQESPWESAGGGECAEEGWAQFDAFAGPAPADPFAPGAAPAAQAMPFWASSETQAQSEAERGQPTTSSGFEDDDKDALTLLLAQKMLTAFHSMPPDRAPQEFHPSSEGALQENAASDSDIRDESVLEDSNRNSQTEDIVQNTSWNTPPKAPRTSGDLQENVNEQKVHADDPLENTDLQTSDTQDETSSSENSQPAAAQEVSTSEEQAVQKGSNVRNSPDVLGLTSDFQNLEISTSEVQSEIVESQNTQSTASECGSSVEGAAPRPPPADR